jgi:hypothetical protein
MKMSEQLTIDNIENEETPAENRTGFGAGSRPRQFFVQATRLVDNKKLWVGPVEERDDAQNLAESLQKAYPDDFSFEPMGKIEARRNGLRSPSMDDSIDTLVDEFTTEEEVWSNVPAEEEKTRRGRPRKGDEQEGGQKEKTVRQPKTVIEKVGNMPKSQETRIVIVTSSSGLVVLLARNGIYGEIIPEVRHRDEIDGAVVYGNLPPWWARYTKSYYVINVPRLRDDQKGSNRLTPEDYINAGITLDEYETNYKGNKSLK